MANLSSDDRPEESTNGTTKRLHDGSTRDSGGLGNEQTVSDSEQTLADSEQTLADIDQTSGERDQTSADSDQAASDRDQAASDRDLAHGVDPREHEASREIRRRTSLQREHTAASRAPVTACKLSQIARRSLARLRSPRSTR